MPTHEILIGGDISRQDRLWFEHTLPGTPSQPSEISMCPRVGSSLTSERRLREGDTVVTNSVDNLIPMHDVAMAFSLYFGLVRTAAHLKYRKTYESKKLTGE